jgi:hypothetical protein
VDKLSRHRGAKLRPKFVLPGAISLFNIVNIKIFLYFHFFQNGSDYVFINPYLFCYLYIFFGNTRYKIYVKFYLLLTHPLTPNAPVRYLDLSIEYSTLDLTLPLNITVDNPLKEESTFFKPPFQFNLKTDLEAVNRLDIRPLASNLTPPSLKCFKYLNT